MLNNSTPQGSYRQKKSGALIFPISPTEKKAKQTQEELEASLDEVNQLKQELSEYLEQLKQGKE